MIFSKNLIFSDDQAITATAASTNVIDLGAPGTPHNAKAPLAQDVAKGTPVPVLVQVTEDFTTLTSLTIAIRTSAASNMGSPTIVAQQTIPVADLKAGKQFSIHTLPVGINQRYMDINYTVGGSNAGAGKVVAGITMGNQTNP